MVSLPANPVTETKSYYAQNKEQDRKNGKRERLTGFYDKGGRWK